MPKRKIAEEGQPSSIYTFRLANGEAFDVQGVKELVEQLVFKSIEFTNKKALAAEIESKHEHPQLKATRRKYSREAKRQMSDLYDKYPVKEAAMEVTLLVLKFIFTSKDPDKTFQCYALDNKLFGRLYKGHSCHDSSVEEAQADISEEGRPEGGQRIRAGSAR